MTAHAKGRGGASARYRVCRSDMGMGILISPAISTCQRAIRTSSFRPMYIQLRISYLDAGSPLKVHALIKLPKKKVRIELPLGRQKLAAELSPIDLANCRSPKLPILPTPQNKEFVCSLFHTGIGRFAYPIIPSSPASEW